MSAGDKFDAAAAARFSVLTFVEKKNRVNNCLMRAPAQKRSPQRAQPKPAGASFACCRQPFRQLRLTCFIAGDAASSDDSCRAPLQQQLLRHRGSLCDVRSCATHCR